MNNQNDSGLGAGVALPKDLYHLPFPCFQAAVNEAEKNIQSGPGMSLMAALSAVTLAAQGIISVELPHGSVVPCSIMGLVLAESGERKSSTFNAFFKAIKEVDSDSRKRFKRETEEWKKEYSEYKEKTRLANKQLKRSKQQGEPLDEEQKSLIERVGLFPEVPILYRILYEDTTGPAFYKGIYDGFPYVGHISTEGSAILKNTAFNDLAKQNLAWDGAPIIIDRVSGDSYVVEDSRITTFIMIQPKLLQKYVEKKGDEVRGSGLWARFIVWQPQAMQGRRTVNNFTTSWNHCETFNDRIKELAEDSVTRFRYGVDPEVISLSSKAKEVYLNYYNYVEQQMMIGGRYCEAGDHASKLPENAARLSASLHTFEKFEGDISEETISAAIRIVDNASSHFLNVFVPPPQEETDALMLDNWFNRYRQMGQFGLAKNFIRQHAPNQLREKNRLNHALDVLYRSGKIKFWMNGRTHMVTIVSAFGYWSR